MNVLVTGGAGYIGTELVHVLDEDPGVRAITVYDNLAGGRHDFFLGSRKLSDKVRFVEGDVLDSRKLRQVLEGVDVVFHLAAKVTTPFADQGAHEFEQVNHWGTAELVYAVEESEVSKFIHVSSVSVHGSSSEPLDVNSPLNPRTFYGISKMRGEEHVDRLAGKKTAYIVRCGNVYGYNRSMRFDAVINKFLFDAHFKGRIKVHGDGTQHRSFLSINKVAPALARFLHWAPNHRKQVLVDRILPIGEVVEGLRGLYPALEFLFVNQHLKLKEMKIHPSPEMKEVLREFPDPSFQEELRSFREAFAFRGPLQKGS